MEKIIDGKRYSTNTAKFVGSFYQQGLFFGKYVEELYKTKHGNFFIHIYNTTLYPGTINENIEVLSTIAAKNWITTYMEEKVYVEHFGEICEG